ncbi:MAG: YihY/virulence factor BrkB family protein [Pseudomonadota bacterium]
MSKRAAKQLGRRTWAAVRVARSAYRRFNRDDGTAMAGYIAYTVFLSLFPFAIFMSALAGVLIGPDNTQAIIDELFNLAPQHIAQTIAPVLEDVIGKSRGGVLTFSALAALWIASNAVEAVRIAFDRAYDSEQPANFFLRRAIAIGFVFLAGVTFAALGFIIILAPLALRLAEQYTGFQAPIGTDALRYLFGLIVFAIFMLILNRWLPSRALKSRFVIPGILVSTALWMLCAFGFSVYLAYAPDYAVTYGAFAGVIVTLLFFYLTGAAVIFGAEVNAALLAMRRRKAERGRDMVETLQGMT